MFFVISCAYFKKFQGYCNCAILFTQVLQEIVDLEKYCELLKKCVKEKEAPLKVVHTRLVTRVSRPGIEACKDSVQYR